MEYIKASQLETGDKVNLKDDKIADPTGKNQFFKDPVEILEKDITGNAVFFIFSNGQGVGFPHEHKIKLV